MFQDLCPDLGRSQSMLSHFLWAAEKESLEEKRRNNRDRPTLKGGRKGGQAKICEEKQTRWKRDGKEEMNPLKSKEM